MGADPDSAIMLQPSAMTLIPDVVDQRARNEPESLYAEYPISATSYQEGYRKITYRDFANAINGVAWWLHKTLGPGKDCEPLAYIGPNDLRYPALVLGAVKAGYAMFLTSPRNSVTAQISLFDKIGCRTLLSPNPRPAPVKGISAAHKIIVAEVPSVDELLEKIHPYFPLQKSFHEALNEPLFIVHTSGSTGVPKPITFTHNSGAKNINMMSLAPPSGFESQDKLLQGIKLFLTFPPFHGACLATQLFNAIFFGTVIIFPISGALPSAEGLVEGLSYTSADAAFIVPSIVRELSQDASLLSYCAENLKSIVYCGGDLPQSIGDVVAAKVRLLNQFGATELGLTPNILSLSNRDPADWKYVTFHPDLGITFRHERDDIYELYMVHDPKKEHLQHTFNVFPELQEYGSRDLFMPHPIKQKCNLWAWCARADDIIVFLNGEKTNPISMEQYIHAKCPEISALLVIGAQRFEAALLIEPALNSRELTVGERAAFIENIWPIVENANKDAPSHARILKSHVLFTHPQKPMLRAGKGTVQRSGTLKLYAGEIDALYDDAEKLPSAHSYESMTISGDLDNRNVSSFLREQISSITKWEKFGDDDDFFTLGMDSLHALLTVRAIRQGFGGLAKVALSTVYTNPSISSLSKAILYMSREQNKSFDANETVRLQLQRDILEQYKHKIDEIAMPRKTTAAFRGEVVILTGSTGALGSYILATLLSHPLVRHVYCLNRASDSSSVQSERNQGRGLPAQFDSDRVTFLTAHLSHKNFGLQTETFEKLKQSANLIIHNAWPVNFNLALPSFRPQFDVIINLLDFSAHNHQATHLLFISSISSIMAHSSSSGKTPERIIHDAASPARNGYAESKYIAELLLDYASRKLSINTSIARVGQLAGAAKYSGLWNKSEWFPSLILSSLHLGLIPESLGPTFGKIDWVPIDLLAEILVDLALHGRQQQRDEPSSDWLRVLHPLNPHHVTWDYVRAIVIDEISHSHYSKKPIETTSPESWLQRVRKDIETTTATGSNSSENKSADESLKTALELNPAAKLLDFYEAEMFSTSARSGMGNELEIRETLGRSEKMRELRSVNAGWIRKWVREWMGAA